MIKKILKSKWFQLFFLFCIILSTSTGVSAQAGNAYDLIGAVNSLRSSMGLADLQVDGILMSIAQAQSDYQASLGYWTHEGPGGTRPRDRAMAAGYGGGSTIFISENVAVMNLSAGFDTLIYSIWSDEIHWNTMTNANYTHAGAGVTATDTEVYYTLDVGYIAGNPGGVYTPGPSLTPGAGDTVNQPTEDVVYPVITSTPMDDGTVIHKVEQGQALWSIAIAYNITINEIVEMNNLDPDNPAVWAGNELIIHPSSTPTITVEASITSQPPTRTAAPSSTPRPPTRTPTQVVTVEPSATPELQLSDRINQIDRKTWGIIVLSICGLGLVLVVLFGFKPMQKN